MSFKEYVLNGMPCSVRSEYTMRPQDIAQMAIDLMREYANYYNCEMPEIAVVAENSNEDEMAELVEQLCEEAENLMADEDLILTTAEGDPACYHLIDADEMEDENF